MNLTITQRVVIETPFYHIDPIKMAEYKTYLAAVRKDVLLNHKEAYFASHALYTEETNDANPDERTIGIEAGLLWLEVAHKSVVYIDYGFSNGMKHGVKRAISLGKPIEFRSLHRKLTQEEQAQFLTQALGAHTTDKEGHIL